MSSQQSYPRLNSQTIFPAKVNPNAATPTNTFPSLPLAGEQSTGHDGMASQECIPYKIAQSSNEPQHQTRRASQATVEGRASQEAPKQFQSPYHTSISDYFASPSSPSSAISSEPDPNPSYMQGGQLPLLGETGDVHASRGADNPFTYNDPVEAILNEFAATEEANIRGQKKVLQLDTEIERMKRNLRAEEKKKEQQASG